MKAVEFLVVGAGQRGFAYTSYLKTHPGEGRVVAVCEPRDEWRARFASDFGVPADRCFRDWRELLDHPRLADAAFVCTVEDLHRDIAVALADKGYHLLLEKPMAPTQEACVDIYAAAHRHGIILCVCHVLRYVSYIQMMKRKVEEGLIGRLRHIQATELVGPWHFTHSFVRGNFRRDDQAAFFLLAKCCHDMDLINHLMDDRCVRASSFGRLSFFKRENQPSGAADRCVKCPAPIESTCPYSALKIYLRDRRDRLAQWPVSMLTLDATPAGVTRALEEGPYGRCAYACDNNVVDHQVVNLEFANGATAGFITTAFASGGRDYLLMGDKGTLRLNDDGMCHHDFLTGKDTPIPLYDPGMDPTSGHGGGDEGVVKAFFAAVRGDDRGAIQTGPERSLESHLIVFAAERSRLSGKVEVVPRVEDCVTSSE
jgi:predicted dehydrogenase